MGKFSEYIGSQCGNPRGIVGKCCCLMMNRMNKAMYWSIIKRVQLSETSKMLDIGYGNGYLAEKIYKKYHSKLYGIDISEDMKKAAVKRNQKGVTAGKIQFMLGDCCSLDFENDFFEAAISVNTIYFWNAPLKGLAEVRRVLKKGGIFYNAVYSKEWLQKLSYTKRGFRLFSKEELTDLGKEAGFSEVLVKDITAGKSYLVQYRK